MKLSERDSSGMVQRPTTESGEFSMRKKDFPPLSGHISSEDSSSLASCSDDSFHTPEQDNTAENIPSLRKEIEISSDGKVTNIPPSLIKDQYGVVGLLTSLRAVESNPSAISLTLGIDLTSLGLDLGSPLNFYPSFRGPWRETPHKPQDNDKVPPEYVITHATKDKMAKVELSKYVDDVLFFIFYTVVKDCLQMAAARELHARGWRYHKEERVWLTPADPPAFGALDTSTLELRTLHFFDTTQWTKVTKKFYLDYSKLESCPVLPQFFDIRMHTNV